MDGAVQRFAIGLAELHESLDEKRTWLADHIDDAPHNADGAVSPEAEAQYVKLSARAVIRQEFLQSLSFLLANMGDTCKDLMRRELENAAAKSSKQVSDLPNKNTVCCSVL